MTTHGIAFLILSALALLFVPRRWAPLPLLIGACYMTLGQTFKVGPYTFTMIRALVAVGVLRILLRGERLVGRINYIDIILLFWAAWALCSSYFHKDPSESLIFRMGMAYNALGIYFLLRVFLQNMEDVRLVCRITIIVLIPLAIEMLSEQITGRNFFSFLGGVPEAAYIRAGKIRAQGPFNHPILAGAVGATSIPLAMTFWRSNRTIALAGLAATSAIIVASRSSGPIIIALACFLALYLWKVRRHMSAIRKSCVVVIVFLQLVMKAPVYYLIARIDLSGGSTGWHRAQLIDAALGHLDEWWWAGTDYTRHWMPYGVTWSPDHVDITNYYIKMGVIGGLPLMLSFIALLTAGFVGAGRAMQRQANGPQDDVFLLWALGSALFGHAVGFISCTYIDQSVVFLYLALAAISSIYSASIADPVVSQAGNPISHDRADLTAPYGKSFRYHCQLERA